jgi:hypothetical protein
MFYSAALFLSPTILIASLWTLFQQFYKYLRQTPVPLKMTKSGKNPKVKLTSARQAATSSSPTAICAAWLSCEGRSAPIAALDVEG